MCAYLFAYGTLQPSLAHADVAPLIARLRTIGEGFARGVLYDLGSYPGAVFDISSQHSVVGTILELPTDPQCLRELDAYEEFDPAAPESSPYLRILHPVDLAAGGTLQCWVYAYNRNPGSAPVIQDGRFRRCG
jgi:gamma-glutamylcyclotransferase (GGCT)/AIG2-like uncharacterized protein YtfP